MTDEPPPLTPLRRSPLVELAVRQLRQQLLTGRWPVSSKLPAETVLAGQLGVGRSTIREAVRALVHAGMLETRQGSGTYVRSLAPDASWSASLRRAAVAEVYEVREALEIQAARLAAARRTGRDIGVLRGRLATRAQARQLGGDQKFVQADLAFHRAVVAAAHNDLLADIYDSFASVLREALVAVVTGRDLSGDAGVARSHERLVAAIEAGDADLAERATREHIGSPAAAAVKPAGTGPVR